MWMLPFMHEQTKQKVEDFIIPPSVDFQKDSEMKRTSRSHGFDSNLD